MVEIFDNRPSGGQVIRIKPNELIFVEMIIIMKKGDFGAGVYEI